MWLGKRHWILGVYHCPLVPSQDLPGHPGTAVTPTAWVAHRAAWSNNEITYPGVAAIPVNLLPQVAGVLALHAPSARGARTVHFDVVAHPLPPVRSPYVTIGAPGPAGAGDSSLFYRHFDAAGQTVVAPPPGPRLVHGVNVPAFAGVAIDVGSAFKAAVEALP